MPKPTSSKAQPRLSPRKSGKAPGYPTAAPIDRAGLAARLREALNDEWLQVAAWYWFDGFDQVRIASMLGVHRTAIEKKLHKIRKAIERTGIPLPERVMHPTAQKDVKSIAFTARD